jgi:alpha-tubulin suppressor-like RCC1 family protein
VVTRNYRSLLLGTSIAALAGCPLPDAPVLIADASVEVRLLDPSDAGAEPDTSTPPDRGDGEASTVDRSEASTVDTPQESVDVTPEMLVQREAEGLPDGGTETTTPLQDASLDSNDGHGTGVDSCAGRIVPVQVSAGVYHTCALTNTGEGRCWGFNQDGELGDGTSGNTKPAPVTCNVGTALKAVVAGGQHTCALTTTLGVRCWGVNIRGELGLAPADVLPFQASPPANDVLTGVEALALGAYHTCALKTNGGVRCWGAILGGTGDRPTPPTDDMAINTTVRAVAAGSFHDCILTTQGTVRCWGTNGYGQLGDGTMNDRTSPAADVAVGTTVQALALGDMHTCVLTDAGGVRCWGFNDYGQLGDGTTDSRLSPPANDVPIGERVQAIAAGANYTCALTSSGRVICWGSNSDGQLGSQAAFGLSPTPVAIGLPYVAVSITAGLAHACALSGDAVAQCWGAGGDGQLGDGSVVIMPHPAPTTVTGFDSACH